MQSDLQVLQQLRADVDQLEAEKIQGESRKIELQKKLRNSELQVESAKGEGNAYSLLKNQMRSALHLQKVEELQELLSHTESALEAVEELQTILATEVEQIEANTQALQKIDAELSGSSATAVSQQ